MKRSFVLLLPAMFLLIFSCTKSVESEMSSWERNKGSIKKLSASYPSFKEFLSQDLQTAEKQMEEANSIADEKQKIEALSAANKTAMFFAGQLLNVEEGIDDLDRMINRVNKEIPEAEYGRKTESEVAYARDLIKEIKASLTNSTPNKDEAFGSLQKYAEQLENTERSLNDILSAYKEKVEEAKKESESLKASEKEDVKNTTGQKEMKETLVSCKYCKNKNTSTTKKCSGCGASL